MKYDIIGVIIKNSDEGWDLYRIIYNSYMRIKRNWTPFQVCLVLVLKSKRVQQLTKEKKRGGGVILDLDNRKRSFR